MLKKLGIITIACAVFMTPAAALAASGETNHSVHFRSAPSVESSIYQTLPAGQSVTVLDEVNKWWVKAKVGSKTGYLSAKYLDISNSSDSNIGTITKGVNFRSEPSINGRVYRTIHSGTKVNVLKTVNRYWVQISVNDQTGYVSTDYIQYSDTSTGSTSGPSDSATLSSIISYGERFLGTPYLFGAEYPTSGKFDCSSFMQYIFAQYDIDLPRTSIKQSKVGTYVSRSNVKYGDLLFFSTSKSSSIGHVGIYVGNGKMLHTYGEGGVKFSTIESGFWDKHYKTARRVL
jgi:cell wall-associated NlpC family hydrolase